jgi:hypothetical protein
MFWDIAPCNLVEDDRRFRGAYCLIPTRLHSAISQTMVIVILAAVRTWNLRYLIVRNPACFSSVQLSSGAPYLHYLMKTTDWNVQYILSTNWIVSTSKYNCRECLPRTVQSVQWLGYSLNNLISIPGRDVRFFSLLPRPDRLWGPPSPLSSGYRGKSGRGVKLTTHLLLVQRSRESGAVPPEPNTSSWRGA